MPSALLPPGAAYAVLQALDVRFDARLYVGFTSTGIYCLPVCRVRLPRRENCRFFGNAASAECAGFRPCLRCRPELSPQAQQHLGEESVQRALAMIAEGALQEQPVQTLELTPEGAGIDTDEPTSDEYALGGFPEAMKRTREECSK